MSKKQRDKIAKWVTSDERTAALAKVKAINKYRNELAKKCAQSAYVLLRSDGAVVGVYLSKRGADDAKFSTQSDDQKAVYYTKKVDLYA